MLITPGQFDNGFEVDFGCYRRRDLWRYRLSMRRKGEEYQVYKFFYYPHCMQGLREVVERGTLHGCVEYVNRNYHLTHTAEGESLIIENPMGVTL